MTDDRIRGYFGVGVERPKNTMNVGTLWRSAVCFNADFIFTVGQRFQRQASDTTASWRQVPCWRFSTVEDWREHVPYDCVPIGVEITDDAVPLETFVHPPRAIYLLGPEDGGLSSAAQAACAQIVQIDTRFCLNLAVAGSILLYDRSMKAGLNASSRWGPRQITEPVDIAQAAAALGRLGGAKGGRARAASLTPRERSAIARRAAVARWNAP